MSDAPSKASEGEGCSDPSLLSRIIFRSVQPTDIPRCYQIESASYPEDEGASKSMLQYRQHHCAKLFRCAFLIGDSGPSSNGSPGGRTSASSSISYQGRYVNPAATLCGTIIGFVCSTRCKALTEEAMKTHDASGKILAIHSVVVEERYRNSGVATAMLEDYISAMGKLNTKGNLKVKMEKMVLMAKKNMLAFYVRNGFIATGLSPVAHGKEQWFELERSIPSGEDTDKTHECYLVDSFADEEKQGSGNPAAVVVLKGPPGVEQIDDQDLVSDDSLDEIEECEDGDDSSHERGVEWMSTVAKEFNQSETAFIWPLPNKTAALDNGCSKQNNQKTLSYAIRYYTRTGVEVDLCGHATLAAAFCVLHPKKLEDPKQNHKMAFFAKNDNLQAELLVPPANKQSNGPISVSKKASRIAMNFPLKNVTPIPPGKDSREAVLSMMSRAFTEPGQAKSIFHRDKLLSMFAKQTLHIGTTDGKEDLLIELTEEGFDSLHGMKVDHRALLAWEGYSRGVIICCASSLKSEPTEPASPSIDFRSRWFGPKVGIDEDPVTGSAHCSLGLYFGNKLGKTLVIGRQESERGGIVECILKEAEGRVCLVGTAVMTVFGQLCIN